MRNVETKIDKNKLVITIDLKADTEVSKSQKSLIIATSEGNTNIGEGITLGINVYRKNPAYVPEKK